MNLLAPETYEGVRRPLLEAETLPPQCYTSREFYKLEVSNIFMKCWNVIGREDYLKKPGDFFAFTVVEIPVFAVKAEDGKIRAFINSCRHRGARLLENEGNCRGIVCPYHAWTYDLQGRLRGATGMADTIGFNAADFGLIEIKVDTWAGFLFVNFDPQSVSLKQYLGRLHEFTDSYGLDSMVTTHRKSFKLRTNWKSYVENSQEVFHLPTIHRRTFGTLKAEFTHTNGAPGNFTVQGTRLTNPKPRSVVEGAASFDQIPTLTGAAAQGAQYILVYPCTIIGCDLDFMWFRSTEPEGPDLIHYKAAFCFPKATAERADFNEVAQNYYNRADLVIAEDNSAAEMQFAGLNQPFGRPSRFSSREPLVHAIDNWILDRVFGAQPAMRMPVEAPRVIAS
jgi:choline monooxygenase